MDIYLLRRLAAIPVTLLGASLLVFAATVVLPGDVARTILGREASDASVAALNSELGLDRPLPAQYLSWLGRFLIGDWGTSATLHAPVRDLVLDRLGASMLIAGIAFAVLVPVALGLGLLAGLHHDRWADRLISGVALGLGATPEFVTGVVLLVVFAATLHWFPVSARIPRDAGPLEALWHLTLPVVSLVLLCTGYVARHVRASTVTVLASPYVRAARLRGMSPARLVRTHVLRNATVPAASALGVQLQFLLGGLVVVELLFDYPGLGALLLRSAMDKDLPTLQACAMVLGAAYMLIVLAADLVYRLLDPRVRLGGAR